MIEGIAPYKLPLVSVYGSFEMSEGISRSISDYLYCQFMVYLKWVKAFRALKLPVVAV